MTAPLVFIDSGARHREPERGGRVRLPLERGRRHLPVLARRQRPAALRRRRSTSRGSPSASTRWRSSPSTRPSSASTASCSTRSTRTSRRVYTWTVVDFIAPETAIRYGPPAVTTSMSAYFGFATNDPTAIIECSLDCEGFGGCESPYRVRGPARRRAHPPGPRGRPGSTTPTRPRRSTAGRSSAAAPNTPTGRNITVELPMPDGPTAHPQLLRDQRRRRDRARRARRRPADRPARLRRRPVLRHPHDRRVRRADPAVHAVRPGRLRRRPGAHPPLQRQRVDRHHASPTTRTPAWCAPSRATSRSSRSPTARRWTRSPGSSPARTSSARPTARPSRSPRTCPRR